MSTMQRYELDEEKFWEIWLDNATVYMRFGKIDTEGQKKLKKCSDVAAATKEVDRFVAEKIKQGYTLVEGSTAKAPPKKTKANTELDKAIIANPDSADGYLVLSDWLTEQGDPLGEYIAVYAALEKKPKDKTLEKKAKELLEKNKASWIGDGLEKLEGDDELSIVWRYGFMKDVILGNTDEFGENSSTEAYEALRKVPTSKFLRSLELGNFDGDDGEPDYSGVLKSMAKNGLPKTLKRLSFDVYGYQVSWTYLGDLSKVYPHLEGLEELELHVGNMKLGASMTLPNLKKLKIKTGGLSKDNLKSIGSGKLPKLETCILYFGEDNYGCNIKIKDVQPIFDGKSLPAVKHLALCNWEHQDEIAKAISGAKILKQLKTLDLSKGEMTNAGAQALVDNAAAFSHLEKLDVSENYIGEAAQKALKKAFGKKVDCSSQGDENEEYRHIQVSE